MHTVAESDLLVKYREVRRERQRLESEGRRRDRDRENNDDTPDVRAINGESRERGREGLLSPRFLPQVDLARATELGCYVSSR